MGILEVDGDEPNTTRLITNQPEIEQQIHDFYSNLYRKRVTSTTEADLKGFMGDIGYNMFHNSAKNKISPYVFELTKYLLRCFTASMESHQGYPASPGNSINILVKF